MGARSRTGTDRMADWDETYPARWTPAFGFSASEVPFLSMKNEDDDSQTVVILVV